MIDITNRPSIFDEMISLREAVNNLFENSFLSPTFSSGLTTRPGVTLNVYEDATSYYVLGLLPGINPDKLEINVQENVLTLSGEYNYSDWPKMVTNSDEANKTPKDGQPPLRTLVNEIPQGRFYRQLTLPVNFEAERIEAHYDNGVLKLTLPKTQQYQIKRIKVRPAMSQLEGQIVAKEPQLAGSRN